MFVVVVLLVVKQEVMQRINYDDIIRKIFLARLRILNDLKKFYTKIIK